MAAAACLVLLAAAGHARAEVSVLDDLGARVTLVQPAKRILSLSPHTTEMLFAIGAGHRVVGVVDYSDFPPEANRIPNVGSSSSLDFERILSLRPDLVVVWASGTPRVTQEKLRKLGLTLFASEPRRLEQIASALERLSQLTATEPEGARAAGIFRERVAGLAAKFSQRPPVSLFYQLWDRPLTTVAGDQLLGEVFTLCGGRNVFGQIKSLAPQLDIEAVLAANPQLIVAAGTPEQSAAWLDSWRRWPTLQAVRSGNLYSVDADLTQRQGPRVVQGAEQLCERLEQVRTPAKPKAPAGHD